MYVALNEMFVRCIVIRSRTPNKRDTSNLREIRSAFSAESVSTHPPVYICPYFTAYIRCVYTSRASLFPRGPAVAGDCKKSTALRATEFFFQKVKPNVTGAELIAGVRVITTPVCPKAHDRSVLVKNERNHSTKSFASPLLLHRTGVRCARSLAGQIFIFSGNREVSFEIYVRETPSFISFALLRRNEAPLFPAAPRRYTSFSKYASHRLPSRRVSPLEKPD